MNIKQKNILVAGGSGFIGSYLCKKLLENNHKITCIDNLSTGNKRNIAPFLNNDNFKFYELNIINSKDLTLISNFKFDEIYNLASPASVTYITDRPVEAALANSLGTKNLLEIALSIKSKFLFASSSESYGDPKEHPQSESYWGNVNPVGIRSGYDEGKRFGEALCMAYHREYKVDTKIVRIFNTYGPNSSPTDSRVIPRLVTQALKNESLTVHGDGRQTRSLCFVTDLVDGMIKVMESSETGPINLGNPEEFTILQLAENIIKQTKSKSKIVFVKRPADDPSLRKPNINYIKNKLNWSPKVSFEQGLVATIDYFKEII